MSIDLQLVYRALRTISDWTVHGYYSELYVEGEENVPRDGPLIIASNHHNEIIDVATLSITIPHRRQLCFWTKSTLFRNPLSSLILSSSGAIPVQRNPNTNSADGSSKAALFHSSTMAFAKGKVVGVFPEGTSYTSPTIAQVMSGAAWAAVEYTRWQREDGRAVTKDVAIVPVGIAYTDKTRFGSSLRVQYGTPISMSDYVDDLFRNPMGASVDDVAYGVVREITERMEQQLFAMTINASDWETLYAAETLHAVVYGRERTLSLKDWVPVTQRFIDLLSDPAPSEPLGRVKESLIKYSALLQRTNLSHSDLPCIPSSSSRLSYFCNLALPSLYTVILAPLYVPALLFHIPACISSELMLRLVADHDRPEAFAQCRAIGGGLGVGVATMALLWRGDWDRVLRHVPPSLTGIFRSPVGKALAYLTAGWAMIRCYGLLAPGLHRRLKRAVSSSRILLGVLPPRSTIDVTPYTRLPAMLPSNIYLRRHGNTATEYWDKMEKHVVDRPQPPPIAGRKLVRAVLEQREETERLVQGVLGELCL